MLNILLYVLVIAFLVVLLVVIFASTKPNAFAIRRSISIHAPAADIFPLIADFRHWRKWSPWENLDPGMRRTLGGAETGVGAYYAWDANRKAGAGRMEIIETRSDARVVIKLNFLRPFKAENMVLFTLVPAGNGTNVTWEMTGVHNLVSKIMSMMMNMDRMVGRDFEKGLLAIKAEAETASA